MGQFGGSGSAPGQFNFPGGSAADADGNLYVADVANHRVQKLDPAGAPLAVFGRRDRATGSSTRPGTWPSTARERVRGGQRNNRIQKFAPNGAFLAKWGGYGGGDGQFENPTGVALDSRGHIFVSDGAHNRIQELGPDGSFIAKWGALGGGPGELYEPNGITVDSAGAIWVADESNHRIVRFCCPGADAARSGRRTPAGRHRSGYHCSAHRPRRPPRAADPPRGSARARAPCGRQRKGRGHTACPRVEARRRRLGLRGVPVGALLGEPERAGHSIRATAADITLPACAPAHAQCADRGAGRRARSGGQPLDCLARDQALPTLP